MAHVAIWLAASALAFAWLRSLALRDFGGVTVGAALLLAGLSLITPVAFVSAIILELLAEEGAGGIFGRVIWTRKP